MLLQRTEISLGDRSSQHNVTFRKDILGSLAQKEAQRTAVDASAGVGGIVKELHLPAVECPVFESLADIVYLGSDNRISSGSFRIEGRYHIHQRSPFLECAGLLCIYTEDVNHMTVNQGDTGVSPVFFYNRL